MPTFGSPWHGRVRGFRRPTCWADICRVVLARNRPSCRSADGVGRVSRPLTWVACRRVQQSISFRFLSQFRAITKAFRSSQYCQPTTGPRNLSYAVDFYIGILRRKHAVATALRQRQAKLRSHRHFEAADNRLLPLCSTWAAFDIGQLTVLVIRLFNLSPKIKQRWKNENPSRLVAKNGGNSVTKQRSACWKQSFTLLLSVFNKLFPHVGGVVWTDPYSL